MNTAEKYIEIVDVGPSDTGKTRRYAVRRKEGDGGVGLISWYGGWRKYVFAPDAGSFYDHHCLRMIAEFCERATKRHPYPPGP